MTGRTVTTGVAPLPGTVGETAETCDRRGGKGIPMQGMVRSGGTFIAAELARKYGIKDIDDREIPSLRESGGAPIWSPIKLNLNRP